MKQFPSMCHITFTHSPPENIHYKDYMYSAQTLRYFKEKSEAPRVFN